MESLDINIETKRLNIAAMIAYETSREAFCDSVQQNPNAVILCEQPVAPQRPDNVVELHPVAETESAIIAEAVS